MHAELNFILPTLPAARKLPVRVLDGCHPSGREQDRRPPLDPSNNFRRATLAMATTPAQSHVEDDAMAREHLGSVRSLLVNGADDLASIAALRKALVDAGVELLYTHGEPAAVRFRTLR